MYGIIIDDKKQYYTTKILGYYDDKDDEDGWSRYYIALDKTKTQLDKIYIFNQGKMPYLHKQVLLLNDDQSDWILEESYYGCVNFLKDTHFEEMIKQNKFDSDLIEKCNSYDMTFDIDRYIEIKNEQDAYQFMLATSGMHDAYIKELDNSKKDSLKVLFDGVWGCNVEILFEGDISYCTDSRDPEYYDPYWFDSQIFIREDHILFCDGEENEYEDINDNFCWFKAKKMSYKIIIE